MGGCLTKYKRFNYTAFDYDYIISDLNKKNKILEDTNISLLDEIEKLKKENFILKKNSRNINNPFTTIKNMFV